LLATSFLVCLSLGIAACGGPSGVGISAPGSSTTAGSSTAAGSADVRTGPGVTADTITLGGLTDLTGAYAAAGTSIANAATLYFDQVNAAGGICGRDVRLIVRDHGYDVEKAVAGYSELEPQVLGFEQLLGGPMTAALLTNIESDQVLTAPVSWSSSLLSNPYIAVMGTTYDVETINIFDYLTRRKGLRRGDVVAHVYDAGEYGDNAVLGSRAAGAQLGVTVREVRVAATDADLSAEIAPLKKAGVKAIVLSTGPRQTASAVATAATLGLNVPIVGNSPSFSTALLATPAAAALRARFTFVGSSAPVAADLPEVKKLVAAYRTAYPTATVDYSVVYGYGAAAAYATVLRQACSRKDLTRGGVAAAFRATSDLDTGGLLAPLDFSRAGAPPARKVLVARPDPAVAGGSGLVEGFFEASAAGTYRAPSES
jgi:ABC-type branched-subunit amino acid transport system substrate-binding protein